MSAEDEPEDLEKIYVTLQIEADQFFMLVGLLQMVAERHEIVEVRAVAREIEEALIAKR